MIFSLILFKHANIRSLSRDETRTQPNLAQLSHRGGLWQGWKGRRGRKFASGGGLGGSTEGNH